MNDDNRIDYEWWRNNAKLTFSQGYSDYVVLQQAPSSASVTGHLGTVECPADPLDRPKIVVSLVHDINYDSDDVPTHEPGGDPKGSSSISVIYNVNAEVYPETNLGNKYCSFRAIFPPTTSSKSREPWSSYTVEARYINWDTNNTTITATKATIQNVVFGDVWYCSGQSNMALQLRYTMHRNISLAKISDSNYDNIRIHGMKSNMNPNQPWVLLRDQVRNRVGTEQFLDYSSTCYYFGERLTYELRKQQGGGGRPTDDDEVIPIGLVHTAWGGSQIENWLDSDTIVSCNDTCVNLVKDDQNGNRDGYSLFEWNTLPYVNMTIKGWLWYQGENNMGGGERSCVLGNSERNSGYSCLAVALVRKWRELWSSTAGTTDPNAPFGIVALPWSGTEGNTNMGLMRWAQTGGYGVLPNPAMPNTFLVQAYDVDDPHRATYDMCFTVGCCYPAEGLSKYARDPPQCTDSEEQSNQYGGFNCSRCDDLCSNFCESAMATNFYMGPIHSRSKYPIGSRLAIAAAKHVYRLQAGDNKKGTKIGEASTGPTLAGCAVDPEAHIIRVFFNTTLLGNDVVSVKDYDHSKIGRSKFEVLLTNSTTDNGLCLQKIGNICLDDGHGNQFNWNRSSKEMFQMWTPVDVLTQGDTSSSRGFEIAVNLSSFNISSVVAIRYAWDGTCCWSQHEPSTLETHSRQCPLQSCPVYSKLSGLPANPFLAEIVDGRCKCLSPQMCDGDGSIESPSTNVLMISSIVVVITSICIYGLWKSWQRTKTIKTEFVELVTKENDTGHPYIM